jgi:hypothetical protein
MRLSNLRALPLLLLLVVHPLSASEDSPWRFSGSLKSYFSNVGSTSWMGATSGWSWDTPLRLRLLFQPSNAFSLEVAEELTTRYQHGSAFLVSLLGVTQPSAYRVADANHLVLGTEQSDHSRLLHNLDRLNASLHLGRLDLTLGRQVVSFGSSRMVNPTDVLAPFSLQNPDRESRSGVDAFRARFAWSDLGELDAGWVCGRDADWKNSAAFVKPKFRALGIDIAPLGMVYRKNVLGGLDLQGSIGGAGVWFEGAWVDPDADEQPYPRLSAGCDYNFSDQLYGFLEYHYNGAGEGNPADYIRPSHRSSYMDGILFLLGRQYLIPSITYQSTPLLSVRFTSIANIEDQSLWVMLHLEYNLLKNLYVNVGASVPFGSGVNRFRPTSEYGLYPSFRYVYTRMYF